jgi:hypothetical protein
VSAFCAYLKEKSRTVSRKIKRNRLEVLLHELGEDIARIDTKDSGEIDEFDHIDAPLAALNPRDCRLRGLQSSGDFGLREFGGFSG